MFKGMELQTVERCPVCGSSEWEPLGTRRDEMPVRACKACGSLYLSERPVNLEIFYEQGYFSLSGDKGVEGVGYQTGYTPIQEQLWQVGLALIASDLLGHPFDGLWDVGCATGQFLALCLAFGARELEGVELSGAAAEIALQRGFKVAAADVAEVRPEQPSRMATAWDVIEHVANPSDFVQHVMAGLRPDGLFCFSTPNGDAPRQSRHPADWEGFQHSFEHLTYFSSDGLTQLLAPCFAAVYLYPVQLYGGDFTLGIAARHTPGVRQHELLKAVFSDPDRLVEAVRAGEVSPRGSCGLIALYMMLGHIKAAEALVEHLAPEHTPWAPGMANFLKGAVALRLGHFDEAARQFMIAERNPDLLEVTQASKLALSGLEFQNYRMDKEGYIANLCEQLSQREQELSQLQTSFKDYQVDKEAYIYHLRSQLDRYAKFGRILDLPGRLVHKAKRVVRRSAPKGVRRLWQRLGAEAYELRPVGRVTLYTGDADLYPGYAYRVDPAMVRPVRRIQASLITTVYNEEGSVRRWLDAIRAQTRLPDELVVVDAGSTDRTGAILAEFAASSPFPVQVIVCPGANIAHGRNVAVREACYPVIACTDLGCHPEPTWLERLLAPYEAEEDLDVSAGWTAADGESPLQKTLEALTVPAPGSIAPEVYLPSSRTISFTKAAWEKVGGYPEWLTFAGEDTLFALLLKQLCPQWAFVPEAVVHWDMRNSMRAIRRQAYFYGLGDGESALFSRNYRRDLKNLVVFAATAMLALATLATGLTGLWIGAVLLALLTALTLRHARKCFKVYVPATLSPRPSFLYLFTLGNILLARTCGFLKGMANRPLVARRRFSGTVGTCVIFSGVPIHDSGGGQRPTQLALELLDQGYRVVFLNQYPSYESVQLQIPIHHPHLELCPVSDFDPDAFLATHPKGQPLLAIAEFPHPAFYVPMRALQARGAKLVYDLIDDWRSSLGGDWYSDLVERDYMRNCDLLVASAQTLVERLEQESARPVMLVPNAVNLRLFAKGNYARPHDMVTGLPTLTYIGALWGEWFDWEQMVSLAEAYPEASLVIIGDYHGQCPRVLPNMHFLGLKPQRELPAYLAHSDVALIPFKISDLTQAVSPLKIFEYLAMGVPVVSTPMKEVIGMPYVFTGATHAAFNAQVSVAAESTVEPAVIDRFIRENSWGERVERILSGLGFPSGRRQRVLTAKEGLVEV